MKSFLFLFLCVLSLSSFSKADNSDKTDDFVFNNMVFKSQAIILSKNIQVWRYKIAREDLASFKESSKLGFGSEDDCILLLQFVLLNLKAQNLHFKFIPSMGVPLLLSLESWFEAHMDPSKLTLVPDSPVVHVYEYRIEKTESECLRKVRFLQKKASSDFAEVKGLFLDAGHVPVEALDNRSVSDGDCVVIDNGDFYSIFYVASNPEKVFPSSRCKASVKNVLRMVVEESTDTDLCDVEN